VDAVEARIGLFLAPGWQMRPGERAALEGVLAMTEPGIAIELGTHRGGNLRRIASHHAHVHAFDLTSQVDQADFSNVTFHIGDSHQLLPGVLGQIEREGGNVTFALVDGDHSPTGVKRDVLDLLNSPAVRHGVIVLHDTGNIAVRRALAAIDYASFPKITDTHLDFVPPLPADGALAETWAGLGLLIIDSSHEGPGALPYVEVRRRQDWREFVIDARRQSRRVAGITLRRLGLHPAQRRR